MVVIAGYLATNTIRGTGLKAYNLIVRIANDDALVEVE